MNPVPANLSTDALAAALRSSAQGNYSEEAAVELLIADRMWLGRKEFRRCVEYIEPTKRDPGSYAVIDWLALARKLGTLPATGSEEQFLAVAIGIAGQTKVSLSNLNSLDIEKIHLILHAVAHVGGWHRRNQAARITGVFPTTPQEPPALPTFEDIRINARRCLSDARDWMHSDRRPGETITDTQADAISRFWRGLGTAREALDAATR